MQISHVPLRKTGQFSDLFLDYIEEKDSLKNLYSYPPSIKGLSQAASDRSLSVEKRKVLVKVLTEQYKGLKVSLATANNIAALKEKNTFTITTGHQLNLFTGPLYFIYKILTAIDLAKKLKEAQPELDFVPVYWMASEDHDLEEVDHFYLKGEKWKWETDQKGAVGRMSTAGINDFFDTLPERFEDFERPYLENSTLASATRDLVNYLFGDSGLVILDADNKELKSLFSSVMEQELSQNLSEECVKETNAELSRQGYKTQAHPREINLFYLRDNLRARIVKKADGYSIHGTDIGFSDDEIKQELKSHPERFSPNVITRPLYQEHILPNIAYIGGPGELIYWLQLKSTFSAYKIPFPVLFPRSFAMVLNGKSKRLKEKLSLNHNQLFESADNILEAYIQDTQHTLPDLNTEIDAIHDQMSLISKRAISIDHTLKKHVAAKEHLIINILKKLNKRLIKAEKQKHRTFLLKTQSLKNILFPEGKLQERQENLLSIWKGDNTIKDLEESLNSLEIGKMHILEGI